MSDRAKGDIREFTQDSSARFEPPLREYSELVSGWRRSSTTCGNTTPSLPLATERGAILSHCLVHLQKSTIGPLAGIVEEYQHSDVDTTVSKRDEILTALAKGLVNLISIADSYDITAEQLCQAVPRVMKSGPKPTS